MAWFRILRLAVKASSEFVITGDVAGFLNEFIQLLIPINERNHRAANVLVNATKEVYMNPAEISFGTKLSNEHFKLVAELVGGAAILTHCLDACDDVGFAVGGLMIFLKGLDEFLKRRKRFDIFIGINVPHLCLSAKPGSSKTSLDFLRDLSEIHIFLYAESPSCSVGKRDVGTIEFFGSRDLDLFGHLW